MAIKFGTDGWRAVISDDFTFDNVRRVALAVARFYSDTEHSPRRIVVGYDTRFLSDKYAELVARVFSQNGIEAILSDRPVPTPALSLAAKEMKMTAGIMITASHNPAAYNGIKIKTAQGGAAGVEITSEVEKRLPETLPPAGEQNKPLIKQDLTKNYVKFLSSYVDLKKIKKARFKVLLDSMHGSGSGFMGQVLKGSLIKLDTERADINPSFEGLRPEPVISNLKRTQERLKKGNYDLCVVLDGDADRIAAFAGRGEFIHPQKILGLLMLHMAQDRKMTGGVVKTIAGTNLIDNIAKKLGLKVYETPVGFKYISELMIKENIMVGGEEAGGMGFKDYIPERDG
ncbi:MAG: phosphoglucomutase/phosphomannomutase family protein, partial [Candidatus Omnitrophica bacterium]|nr:phosphoglucomutase/phosphomannomutase family protein [Candidatus Omnitrophota bacterium]